jgi:hypothetical protein
MTALLATQPRCMTATSLSPGSGCPSSQSTGGPDVAPGRLAGQLAARGPQASRLPEITAAADPHSPVRQRLRTLHGPVKSTVPNIPLAAWRAPRRRGPSLRAEWFALQQPRRDSGGGDQDPPGVSVRGTPFHACQDVATINRGWTGTGQVFINLDSLAASALPSAQPSVGSPPHARAGPLVGEWAAAGLLVEHLAGCSPSRRWNGRTDAFLHGRRDSNRSDLYPRQ